MPSNSPTEKPLVVVTRKLPDAVEARMMELFDAKLNQDDKPFTRKQLLAAVGEADALVPTVTDVIDKSLLAKAGPRLKIIANFGTGVDHIDLEAAEKKGLLVTNTPDVLTEDTADLTMALLLTASRRITEGERILRAGKWKGWAPTDLLSQRVHKKRLGIIGMGRIGSAVARRARGFGIAIHYHNRHRAHPDIESELEATYWESLDQMLGHMDFLSVNCPHTPATHHLLSAERLKLVAAHCFIVNTARGDIIDEAALADLIAAGAIAGAGLDVFENEPKVNRKLLKLEQVVLLPHMGSGTEEGRVGMGEKVIVNIKTFIDGHQPVDRVIANLL